METTVKRTWKPTVAAVLILIAALTSGLSYRLATEIGVPPILALGVLVMIPANGCFGAFKRKWWTLALAGAICSILSMPFLGIPALILILNAKHEFKPSQKSSEG